MKKLTLFFLGFGATLFNTSNLLANEIISREDEYQHQVEIQTTEQKGIQKIELPDTIQSKLIRSDAKDLQVFDSAGKLIPTYIEFKGAPASEEIIRQLHFFPIITKIGAKTLDSDSLKFNYSNGNISVQVDTELRAHELETIGIIFENPLEKEEIPEEIKETQFKELMIETNSSFEGSAGVEVKTSSDLNSWSTISSTEKIVSMHFLDQNLVKNRILIPSSASKFIMLTWRGDLKPKIESISGVFQERTTPLDYQWQPISNLEYINENNSNYYQFKLSPAFHSNSFRIPNIKSNEIYAGKLQSKSNKKDSTWDTGQVFTLYKIPNGNDYLENTETGFQTNQNINWRIYLEYPSEPLKLNELAFEFNRHPINVFYLPSGSSPYHLKFGRNIASEQLDKLSKTIEALIADGKTEVYEAKIIGNIIDISSETSLKINWKKILLWAALLFGVLIMAWMARDLFKSLK